MWLVFWGLVVIFAIAFFVTIIQAGKRGSDEMSEALKQSIEDGIGRKYK